MARFTEKHGKSRTRMYKAWTGMLQRCNNPNSVEYSRYGGSGITVCERWHDFANFYADMGERPPGMTLDRIDSAGNYCKSNCRWATVAEQLANRRGYSSNKANKSGVIGVHWKPSHNKFIARITVRGIRHLVGSFDSVEEAKEAIYAAKQRA